MSKPITDDAFTVPDAIAAYRAEVKPCDHNYQPVCRKWDACTKCGDRQ